MQTLSPSADVQASDGNNPQLPFSLSANHQNLWRLSTVRCIVLLILSGFTVVGYRAQTDDFPLAMLFTLLSIYCLSTLITFFRARTAVAISEVEFTGHLFFEVLIIAALAYFTGGATNPIISYLLVPISIAASILRWYNASLVAGAAIGVYTALLFFYQQFELFSHSGHAMHNNGISQSPLNAHYFGMWVNFLISALLIAWFVAKMAQALRQQQSTINEQREYQLQQEQVVAIASLAAGTAHELGTPLNSLKLLVDNLDPTPQQVDTVALLQSQITRCETSLRKLVSTAQHSQLTTPKTVNAGEWLQSVVASWRPMHPEIETLIDIDQAARATINVDETLKQSIINLLDNAANASASAVSVHLVNANKKSVDIRIKDNGTGIDDHVARAQGKTPVPKESSSAGLGVGIFLSNASINRLGGTLQLRNHYDSSHKIAGAEVILHFPKTTSSN